MDELLKMYRPVEDFLKEIRVNQTWELNTGSTILDDEVDVESEHKVVLFNGLTFTEFVKDLDKILRRIAKKVKEPIEQSSINPNIIRELRSLHQSWIVRLESKDYEVVKATDEINQSTQELSDRLVNTITYLLNEHFRIYPHPKSKKPSSDEKDVKPIRWNESINKLADIFYQLSVELKNGEKRPLIETSPANLAKFIANNFVDENGKPINISTVQTILKPSKIDKRPASFKGVTIHYTPM